MSTSVNFKRGRALTLHLERSDSHFCAWLVLNAKPGDFLAYAAARAISEVRLRNDDIWIGHASFSLTATEIARVHELWPDIEIRDLDGRASAGATRSEGDVHAMGGSGHLLPPE